MKLKPRDLRTLGFQGLIPNENLQENPKKKKKKKSPPLKTGSNIPIQENLYSFFAKSLPVLNGECIYPSLIDAWVYQCIVSEHSLK